VEALLEKPPVDLDQRRLGLVRDLLGGDPLAGPALGIDLDRYHLGLICWGGQGQVAATELASSLGRTVFTVRPAKQTWWAWISGFHPLDPAQERTLQAFRSPAGAGIALGLESFGEVGFRATNRQAQRARRVTRESDLSRVSYADVAVEALACTNEEDARAFLAHELRGIDDDSPTSRRIRDTIRAYFAAGHNAASAAAALGIHEQTVANRLRAAEERLGHPVGLRRVELEVALRLRASLCRADP
jgi:DNA-binding PucR family transcriptional regulator